jgi:CHAD domain-containing protein
VEKTPAIDDLRAVLGRQLARMEATEPGVREGADARDLHKFRVAARRSRALIRASRRLVGDQLAGLDAELRWLGSRSGSVRDLDVLIERLGQVVAELGPDRDGGEAIMAALVEERGWAREALVEALDSDRYRALPAMFGAALAGLTVVDPDVRLRKLAKKALKRARAAYEGLGPDPPDEELHALRIRVKRARYAAELAALTEGRELTKLAEALTEAQDVIGEHQDAVVAEKRVRALAPREALVAAGRIIEQERWRRARARASLPHIWQRVDEAARHAF